MNCITSEGPSPKRVLPEEPDAKESFPRATLGPHQQYNLGPLPRDVRDILFSTIRAGELVSSMSVVCKAWRRTILDDRFVALYRQCSSRYARCKIPKHIKNPLDKLKKFAQQDRLFAPYETGEKSLVKAPKMLFSDYELVLRAVSNHQLGRGKNPLFRASKELKANRRIVLAAVRADGTALEYVAREFRDDREIVLEAVTENGWALRCANPRFCDDKEIVLAGVKNNHHTLKHVSPRLRDDPEFALTAVKTNQRALQYLPRFQDDREFLLAAIEENSFVYKATPVAWHSDYNFVLEAVRRNGWVLEQLHSRFKADRKIVLEAVSKLSLAFQFAAFSLQKDPEIALTAIKGCPVRITSVPDDLINDRSFILKAVKTSPLVYAFLPPRFKDDDEIRSAAGQPPDLTLQLQAIQANLRSGLSTAHLLLMIKETKILLEEAKQETEKLEFEKKELAKREGQIDLPISQEEELPWPSLPGGAEYHLLQDEPDAGDGGYVF